MDASTARRSQESDEETNPLFISAVRIFLDYVRDQHNVPYPEKCSLDQLVSFLAEFQEVARTKKGEQYSPSTIRVIRYSLNRVIALGKSAVEMRPYPTHNTGVRKRQRDQELFCGGRMENHARARSSSMTNFRTSMDHDFNGPVSFASGDMGISRGASPALQQQQQHELTAFRGFLVEQHMDPNFESYSPMVIKEQLEKFLVTVQANLGSLYAPNSVQSMRRTITNHLLQKGIDIDLKPSIGDLSPVPRKKHCNSFSVTRLNSAPGPTEWLGIPVESIGELYRSGALSVESAVALQRKVWFELTIFFRAVPCCPDHMFWNKKTFQLSSGEHGVKYVELNPEMYNRFASGHFPTGVNQGRIMVQRAGSPYCPVASFELYLKCLSASSEVLFTQPDNHYDGSAGIPFRFSTTPLSPKQHGTMMASIAEAAKLPHHFTNLSAAETDHIAWMRSLTALELELQCQMGEDERDTSYPEDNSIRGSVIQSVSKLFTAQTEALKSGARAEGATIPYGSSAIGHGERSSEGPISLIWKKKVALTYNEELLSQKGHVKERRPETVHLTPRITIAGPPDEGSKSGIIKPRHDFLNGCDNSGEKKVEVPGLTSRDLIKLYSSDVFDTNQPGTLQNKVLFEMVLTCGDRFDYPRKLKFWLRKFFHIVQRPDGSRLVTSAVYSGDSDSAYPNLVEVSNSTLCPVRSYEKYTSLLPEGCSLFFPECLQLNDSSQSQWYGNKVGPIGDLHERVRLIGEKADLQKELTISSVLATPMSEWIKVLHQLAAAEDIRVAKRPAVKHVLERYRRETTNRSHTDEDASDISSYSAGSRNLDSPGPSRSMSDATCGSGPIVLVRPQVLVFNQGCTVRDIDISDLKEKVKDAMIRAARDTDWDTILCTAVSTENACGGRCTQRFPESKEDQASSLTASYTAPAVKFYKSTAELDMDSGLSRGESQFFGTGMTHSTGAFLGPQSSLGFELEPEDVHGPFRRKTFKPITQ